MGGYSVQPFPKAQEKLEKRENNQCPNRNAWFWGNAECGGSLGKSLPAAPTVAAPPPAPFPPVVAETPSFRGVGPAVALLLLERKPGPAPTPAKPLPRSSVAWPPPPKAPGSGLAGVNVVAGEKGLADGDTPGFDDNGGGGASSCCCPEVITWVDASAAEWGSGGTGVGVGA